MLCVGDKVSWFVHFFCGFLKITSSFKIFCNFICTFLLVLFCNDFLVSLLSCLYCHFKIMISIVFFFFIPSDLGGHQGWDHFYLQTWKSGALEKNQGPWRCCSSHVHGWRTICDKWIRQQGWQSGDMVSTGVQHGAIQSKHSRGVAGHFWKVLCMG